MPSARKRPILDVGFWTYDWAWGERCICAGLILAPFPPEEQQRGNKVRALLNFTIGFYAVRPFIRYNLYCADRSQPPGWFQ